MAVSIKRAYQEAGSDDGYRVLVDRVWPRGVSKEDLKLDDWLKSVAPSTELRKWFDHDPNKFSEFKKRYKKELSDSDALEDIRGVCKAHKNLTLVYGAKDEEHNNAVVLQEILNS